MRELVDLEVLLIRCRQERAKTYIKEAIACYHAGAYRAAVISTWIAVVYDFVGKLDQLALAGDKNATTLLEDFKKICSAHDIVRSLEFERSVPRCARSTFELISEIEFQNLTRLWEERHRCAHPSMISGDEVYDPGPETARYHLRNAIESLLQHEPSQGKHALDRIFADLDSDLFPESVEEVVVRLQGGPLRSPRQSLLRNYVMALLKTLLVEQPQPAGGLIARIRQESEIARRQERIIQSLSAIHRLHPSRVNDVFKADLPVILSRTEDSRIGRLVRLIAGVRETLDAIPEAQLQRIEAFVRQMPVSDIDRALPASWSVEWLRPAAKERIDKLLPTEWGRLKGRIEVDWLPYAIKCYQSSADFEGANAIAAAALVPHAPDISKEQAAEIIACASNAQVRYSFGFVDVLRAFCSDFAIGRDFVQERLHACGFADQFKDTVSPIATEGDGESAPPAGTI
jgi:hypothetical protein